MIPPYSSENLTEEKGDTETTSSDTEAGDTKDFPETKVSSEVDASSDNMEKDLDQSDVEKEESVKPESTTDITPGTNVDDTSQEKSLQNEQFTAEQVGILSKEHGMSDELRKEMDDAQQVALKEISETAETQTIKDDISKETDDVNIPESDLGQVTIDLEKPKTENREQGQLDGETPTIMDDKLQKDAMEQSKGEIIDVSQEPGELSEVLDNGSAGTTPADFEVGPAEDRFDKDKIEAETASKEAEAPSEDLQEEIGQSERKEFAIVENGVGMLPDMAEDLSEKESSSVLDDVQKELSDIKPRSINQEVGTIEGNEKKAEQERVSLLPPYNSENLTEEKGDTETTSSDTEAGDTKDFPETKVSSEVDASSDNMEKDLDQSDVEKEESVKPESTTDITPGTNVDDTSQEKSLQNEQFTAEQVGILSKEPGMSDELRKEIDDAQQVALKEISETAETQTIKDDISKETDDVNIPESDLGQVTIDLEKPKTENREQGQLDGETPTIMDDKLQKDAMEQSKGEIIDVSQEPGELSEVLDNGSAGTTPADFEVGPAEDRFDKDKIEAETASKEAEAPSEDLQEEISQSERKEFAIVENGVGMLPDMAEDLSEKESSSVLDDVQNELSDIKPRSINEEVGTVEGNEKKAEQERVSLLPPYSSENLTEEKGDTETTSSDTEAGDTKDFPETKVSSEVDASSDNMEKDLDQSDVEKEESVKPESTTDITPGTNVDDTSQEKSLQNEQFTAEQVGISSREPEMSDELCKEMDNTQQVALKEISETAKPQKSKDIAKDTDEVGVPESDLSQFATGQEKPTTDIKEHSETNDTARTVINDEIKHDMIEQSKSGELSDDLDKDGTKAGVLDLEGTAEDSSAKPKNETEMRSQDVVALSDDLKGDINLSERKEVARVENGVGMLPSRAKDVSTLVLDDAQRDITDVKPRSIESEIDIVVAEDIVSKQEDISQAEPDKAGESNVKSVSEEDVKSSGGESKFDSSTDTEGFISADSQKEFDLNVDDVSSAKASSSESTDSSDDETVGTENKADGFPGTEAQDVLQDQSIKSSDDTSDMMVSASEGSVSSESDSSSDTGAVSADAFRKESDKTEDVDQESASAENKIDLLPNTEAEGISQEQSTKESALGAEKLLAGFMQKESPEQADNSTVGVDSKSDLLSEENIDLLQKDLDKEEVLPGDVEASLQTPARSTGVKDRTGSHEGKFYQLMDEKPEDASEEVNAGINVNEEYEASLKQPRSSDIDVSDILKKEDLTQESFSKENVKPASVDFDIKKIEDDVDDGEETEYVQTEKSEENEAGKLKAVEDKTEGSIKDDAMEEGETDKADSAAVVGYSALDSSLSGTKGEDSTTLFVSLDDTQRETDKISHGEILSDTITTEHVEEVEVSAPEDFVPLHIGKEEAAPQPAPPQALVKMESQEFHSVDAHVEQVLYMSFLQ